MGEKRKIKSFTDLIAWREAHHLVLETYKHTKCFPETEKFSLTNQVRRAVVSIASNIAEGFSRRTKADKRKFYYQSLGSLTEVQSQLIIAKDLDFFAEMDFEELYEITITVSKLVNSLIKSLAESQY